jgi:hypothetical protein
VSATLGRTRINDIQIAALGSGLASGFAPFVLGRLSDVTNLRTAYLIVPALLVGLARARRHGAQDPLAPIAHHPGPVSGPLVQVQPPAMLTWAFSVVEPVQSSVPLTLPTHGWADPETVSRTEPE